jgi:hypothetical protein|tara:strand:+ start:168 stop:560 length:393 start_codon:yes stop_codon:yes gene_type:complete
MGEKLMSSYKEQMFVSEFKSFLDERVDCRLENIQNGYDQTAKLELLIEELDSKVDDLESHNHHCDHESRIEDLESSLEELERGQLLNDVSAMVNQQITALITAGRLSLHLKPPIEIVDTSEEPYKVQQTY